MLNQQARNLKRINPPNCNDNGYCRDDNHCPKLVFEIPHPLIVVQSLKFVNTLFTPIVAHRVRQVDNLTLPNELIGRLGPSYFFDLQATKRRACCLGVLGLVRYPIRQALALHTLFCNAGFTDNSLCGTGEQIINKHQLILPV